MSKSRARLAADWFAKLRQNAVTQEVEHTDVVDAEAEALGLEVFGEGMAWYEDSGRAAATWYQNTTGRTIIIQGRQDCNVLVGPSTASYQTLIFNNGSSYGLACYTVPVPPNYYYYVTSARTGANERNIFR